MDTQQQKISTKLVLTNENGEYTVEHYDSEYSSCVTLDEVMTYLVKPVLLSAGYHIDNISEYIPES